jgi:hypothetical protein
MTQKLITFRSVSLMPSILLSIFIYSNVIYIVFMIIAL